MSTYTIVLSACCWVGLLMTGVILSITGVTKKDRLSTPPRSVADSPERDTTP